MKFLVRNFPFCSSSGNGGVQFGFVNKAWVVVNAPVETKGSFSNSFTNRVRMLLTNI